MMGPPPSPGSIVSASPVLALGPRFSVGEHQEGRTRGARRSAARAGGSRLGARMATGQPLPLLGEDDAEKQEEGRLVQFREDWCG